MKLDFAKADAVTWWDTVDGKRGLAGHPSDNHRSALTFAAAHGWELVTVTEDDTMFFKRPAK